MIWFNTIENNGDADFKYTALKILKPTITVMKNGKVDKSKNTLERIDMLVNPKADDNE
jgi:hypothetical protein